MKKSAAGKPDPAKDAAAAEATEDNEPEVPQSGFGKFEYINQTLYVGEWKLIKGRKVKHGQGKITFPGVSSG